VGLTAQEGESAKRVRQQGEQSTIKRIKMQERKHKDSIEKSIETKIETRSEKGVNATGKTTETNKGNGSAPHTSVESTMANISQL
jgi:hypothetical protein